MAALSIALMLAAAHMATVEGENSIGSADPESRRS